MLVPMVLEEVAENVVELDMVGVLMEVLLDVAVVEPGMVVEEGFVVGRLPPPGGVLVGWIVVVGRDGVAAASADMETCCEGGAAVVLKRIRWSVRDGANVGVEVIQAAWAHVADVFETHRAKDGLAIACKPKLLLPEAHIKGAGRDPRRGIEGPGVAARGGSHCSRLDEHCDHKDRVLHGFPSVGSTHEVVTRRVVRLHHCHVCRVTVEAARSWPVPVDKLIRRDLGVCRS